MSVAFRRESDEEHLEPKFEIPIPPGPNLVTARGLAMIQDRVAELEALLPTVEDEAGIAAVRRDLRYWRTRQATAELAPVPAGTHVEFGTVVTFRLRGEARTVAIVGDDEAEPAAGRLSFTAPLSRALMGAEPGDLLPFAGAEDAIEVVSVAVPTDPSR